MAINVNPPPQIVLPKVFKEDLAVVDFFEQQNRMLLQLWTRTGGATDSISDLDNKTQSGFNSMVQQLQREIDGLPEFTIDTTGFTIDTTLITTDKAAT